MTSETITGSAIRLHLLLLLGWALDTASNQPFEITYVPELEQKIFSHLPAILLIQAPGEFTSFCSKSTDEKV